MSNDSQPKDRTERRRSRSMPCIALGVAASILGLILLWRPASVWLRALSPDGTLEANTAMLLDRFGPLALALGIVLLCCGFVPGWRAALAGAATSPLPAAATRARWLAPGCAALALLLRLAIAARTDVGLGDDGARVVWLEQWLRDPQPVWTGLWLPAHLYLHALFYVVIRDAVWAGVVLSAVAAAGTVWILSSAVESRWGRTAAAVAGITASILPVSLAYGATPDVNPVFAFFVVAAMAAVSRGARPGAGRWLLVGWWCLVTATWMRFDSLPLVPLVAALLWPRRLAILLFTLAGVAPLVGWNVVNAMLSQASGGGPLGVMAKDPTLGGSPISLAFGFLGAIWQAVTLPVVLLGLAGMWRAWKARTSRAWMLPIWGHLAALAGGVLVLGAGLQPRYFILIGTITAAYAGIGFAGIAARRRDVALAVGAAAAFLLATTPALNSQAHDLWIRRDPELRALADEVASRRGDRHVVWVAEEAGYFYACRVRPAVGTYHALPRADSDPAVLLEEIRQAPGVIAVVQQAELPRQRWGRLLELAAGQWYAETQFERGGYRVYFLQRSEPTGP
jgi:hypothetical protein